ncbi:MAG: hypothetical protein ACKO24_15155 [Leptolyngbyaceae cyanobacterium]
MLGMNCWQKITKALVVSLLTGLILLAPVYEKGALAAFGKLGLPSVKPAGKLAGRLSETSPPEVIQELRQVLEDNQPQVKILSPKPDEVLDDTTVSVRLRVNDLPIFKDKQLGLGPHLYLFLDDRPYQAVYDIQQPFVLENLNPGTHTLRVFASRPWHESFKNEGAYSQTTFHVFTKTQSNRPNPDLPLVTYSRPAGSYGAEPIMLDFYLTNAPLHLVAQENHEDDIADWRIRVTVNGDSFIVDRWQPIYLKGFKPGKNWVQVEYLDEKGNPVENLFNNTARLITLEPGGNDTLSRLIRGELTAAQARGIVDPKAVSAVVKQPQPAAPSPVIPPESTPEQQLEPLPPGKQPPVVEPKPEPVLSPVAKPPLPPESAQKPVPIKQPAAAAPKSALPVAPPKPTPTPAGVKQPAAAASKSMPPAAPPKLTPTPESAVEPIVKLTTPVKPRISAAQGWFDKIRERLDSRKPVTKPTPPAQSITSPGGERSNLETPLPPTVAPTAPGIESPKQSTPGGNPPLVQENPVKTGITTGSS